MAKLSGPRMKNGNYYSKRKNVVKKKKVYNKQDIKQIAKNVLYKSAESKYFGCLSMDNLTNDGTNTTNRGQLLYPSGQP